MYTVHTLHAHTPLSVHVHMHSTLCAHTVYALVQYTVYTVLYSTLYHIHTLTLPGAHFHSLPGSVSRQLHQVGVSTVYTVYTVYTGSIVHVLYRICTYQLDAPIWVMLGCTISGCVHVMYAYAVYTRI